MTLPFSTKWGKNMGDLAGKPNYFIQKIWEGFTQHQVDYYWLEHKKKFGYHWDENLLSVEPKLHTIRLDPHDRWKAGMKIHPVINNRTKNRFQFAPVIECVSVQSIEITKSKLLEYGYAAKIPLVYIDDVLLESDDLEKLAINDGFPTLKAFFDFFNRDFTGKIIHWTDLKY